MRQIYFDNAATTFPKPPSVAEAVREAALHLGGNPGRGGHYYSKKAAEAVYRVREQAAEMFCAEPENTVFTLNCTHSLNLAIKGILRPGDRAVISSMEHNSVARPVYALTKKGIRAEVAMIGRSDAETVENFGRLIKTGPRCVICTAASNVTGRINPIREIAALCRESGVCFIVDGAQACGIIPISLRDGMNFFCTAGHKGLYGPTGTGLLISDGKYALNTVIEGGTGATSAELEQTGFMPERLESGTVNSVGIAGLGAGIAYLKETGTDKIRSREEGLCSMFIDGIKNLAGAKIYRRGENFVPIVSFNLEGIPAEALAGALSSAGFALRGGLHCAVLAHETLSTFPFGAVRFSPSVFSSEKDVAALINEVKKIYKNGV